MSQIILGKSMHLILQMKIFFCLLLADWCNISWISIFLSDYIRDIATNVVSQVFCWRDNIVAPKCDQCRLKCRLAKNVVSNVVLPKNVVSNVVSLRRHCEQCRL